MRHSVGSFVELQVTSPRCHVYGNGSPVYHAVDAVVALQILTMQINKRWSMPNHTVNQDLLCRPSFQTRLNLLQALASAASQILFYHSQI